MKIAGDGIHVLDMEGRLVEANDAFLRMIGRPREDIGRLNVRDWDAEIPPEDMAGILATVTPQPRVFETLHRGPGGRLIEVEINVGRVELDGSAFILGVSRDISARKELERQLLAERAQLVALNQSLEERVARAVTEIRSKDQLLITQGRQAAMGEMIGNIAHQWRQPLNALSLVLANLGDAARAGELDAPVIEEALGNGNRLIQKMSSTINDFRDFFTPGKQKSVFSAREAVLQALALIDASYRHAGVELELDESSDVRLLGFSNEYSQIVLNLLANAKQAIQGAGVAHGRVTLRFETRQGLGCLVVRDNGGGIPDAILDRIFDPYFSTKEGGSGIGLYMSRQIAEKSLSGRLEARNVDGGAEFTVLTPLAVAP
jgi:PAS domain S-box-containing protein